MGWDGEGAAVGWGHGRRRKKAARLQTYKAGPSTDKERAVMAANQPVVKRSADFEARGGW